MVRRRCEFGSEEVIRVRIAYTFGSTRNRSNTCRRRSMEEILGLGTECILGRDGGGGGRGRRTWMGTACKCYLDF